MRSTRDAIVSFALLFAVTVPQAARAETAPAARAVELCPKYGQHLERAQAALAHGQRASAIESLRAAEVALRRCEKDDAVHGVLLG